MEITVVDHPLAAARLTALRDERTTPAVFRAALAQLSTVLVYEAALTFFPEAAMGFVGLARDETTLRPTAYLESLPADLGDRPVMVLDPMPATGGSLEHCLRLLVSRGARDIIVVCALAAPEGLERLRAGEWPVRVVTASVDSHLNDVGYIVPGLGDAGDRQFGAV